MAKYWFCPSLTLLHMKQIAPLTDAEELTLTEAYHNHPIFRVRQRAHALLLNRRGYSMARLRELFEVQHETVSRWLQRWESEGLTGLMDGTRSGCPQKLDDKDVELVMKAIKKNPHQLKMAQEQLQANPSLCTKISKPLIFSKNQKIFS